MILETISKSFLKEILIVQDAFSYSIGVASTGVVDSADTTVVVEIDNVDSNSLPPIIDEIGFIV